MVSLWSLGGLSWRELLRRTWRESWEDSVFGQAARLAFYHFLAIFPALLLLLFLLIKLGATGSALRNTLLESFQQILPGRASVLMEASINALTAKAEIGMSALPVALSAIWAAVNGTWAMMRGLNTAYEVKERRPLWKVLSVAFALSLALVLFFFAALTFALYTTRAAQAAFQNFAAHPAPAFLSAAVEWPVLTLLLLASFALLYRFAPNLDDREWQWSTPGAVLAVILWLGATVLLRTYFARFHSYDMIYQQLNGVAMLLMWLYLTSAAVLIGGELNSEIEKNAEQKSGAKADRTA